MVKIIPTILTNNKKDFEDRYKKLSFSDMLQIDFMDGKFVKNKSVSLEEMPSFFNRRVEAHLMVEKPEEYISALKKKGFKKIIFHYESFSDKSKIRDFAKDLTIQGLKPVLAINPETKLEDFYELTGLFTTIMFLGVNPGKENQEFQKKVIDKIKKLRDKDDKILIQVDGGVNPQTAKNLKGLVNIVNSGSYISENEDPEKAFNNLRKVFE